MSYLRSMLSVDARMKQSEQNLALRSKKWTWPTQCCGIQSEKFENKDFMMIPCLSFALMI